MRALSVTELLEGGSVFANQDVVVTGYVWDRFEHRALYETLPAAGQPESKSGVCLAGQLPERPSGRGDGPLHGKHIAASGEFHWTPKAGAGHFGLWPAWLAIRQFTLLC